ncbi:MAG: MotA/TolQ/ExbB proton channel family protein [Treponema sp.]|nr:MotA/TolQ/ExbB proton channel family protein [Treponema sp.]
MDSFLLTLGKFFCETDNFLILALALANLVIYILLIVWNTKTRNILHPEANKTVGMGAEGKLTPKDKDELSRKRSKLTLLYSIFANFTAIFPLLGILGTVASLMTNTRDTMMDNLMIALNTTLLGVIFAIFFKALDAFVSARMELNLEEIDMVLDKKL